MAVLNEQTDHPIVPNNGTGPPPKAAAARPQVQPTQPFKAGPAGWVQSGPATPWQSSGVDISPGTLLTGGKAQSVARTQQPPPKALQPAKTVVGEIQRQAQLQGMPAGIALAVAKEESGFNQTAVSSAGAIGVMQLMPATADGLGVDPHDWRQNIRGGITYLMFQYKRFGNWPQALAAYNAGPNAVSSGNIPSSTRSYVSNIMALSKGYGTGKGDLAGGDKGVDWISAPLPGNIVITSGFGPRNDPFGSGGGDFHYGVDMAAPQGTPIHAMIGGKVTYSAYNSGSGNTVTIQDRSGRLWSYFHMVNTPPVKVGQKVKAGFQIGNVGTTGESTGPHLDIHLMVGGKWVNPSGIINQAFKAGWDKTSKITLATSDFLAPGQGGPSVAPGPVQGSGGAGAGGAYDVGAALAQTDFSDVAHQPGAPTLPQDKARAAWQQILDSGATSPEAKHLAQQAGAFIDRAPVLAAQVTGNPGAY